jgi:hypothetical protein
VGIQAGEAIQQHVGGQDCQGGCQKPHLTPHAASVEKNIIEKKILIIRKRVEEQI